MNPENHCIQGRRWSLGQTNKQTLSNFKTRKLFSQNKFHCRCLQGPKYVFEVFSSFYCSDWERNNWKQSPECVLYKRYSQLLITKPWWGTRGLLGTKTKIFRNGEGLRYRVGVSIGIASKDPVKRVRQVFLKIVQNSQENICARVSFFNKVAGLRPEKRDFDTGVFLWVLQKFKNAFL